jgi:protein-L-isoaspartate(D-aspartate) O-methyltransferase
VSITPLQVDLTHRNSMLRQGGPGMTDKRSSFPLPLSSVDKAGTRKPGCAAPVATPQTATQNAARHVAPQHGYSTARPVAAPSKSHSYAMGGRSRSRRRRRDHESDLVPPRRCAAPWRQRVARQGVKDAGAGRAGNRAAPYVHRRRPLSSQAYIDASLPIGHHQTISQPYIVARMIE